MNKRQRGNFYEELAANYLSSMGVEILERNYRCRLGEIDIIGVDRDSLVFFEIKYRRGETFGTPFDAIDIRKQRRIINVAKFYLVTHSTDKYIRFDAVGITGDDIEWIKNAFCL